jgi:ABC-type uncharacterized transport system permease subunit
MKPGMNKFIIADVLKYLFHPALYIVAGAVCGIVSIFLNTSLLWMALLIEVLAVTVYYSRKISQAIHERKWKSMWLEEDFIA